MKAELLILGVLHRGNFHPYEIKRRLSNAMVECFTDVDVGTLYYAIRQLTSDECIAAQGTQKVGRGGQRTVYRITRKGRERFSQLLDACFEAEGSVADTLYVAMLFIQFGDRSRIEEMLRQKILRQKAAIEKLAVVADQFSAVLGTGSKHLLDHLHAQRRLDLRWLKALEQDISSNGIRDLANPQLLQSGRA